MTRLWKTLKSTYLLRHRMVSFRQDTCQLPNGRVIDDYFVVEEPDAVLVFALTEARELIMVEQYKHGIGKICLELPGGYMDAGEDPMLTGQRELLEETGYAVDSLVHVVNMVVQPTRNVTVIRIFAATTPAIKQAEQALDANEDITIKLIPIAQVFDLIHDNTIDTAVSVVGIYRAWEMLRDQF